MKEAILYKKLNDQKTQCHACSHFCLILPEQTGICGVRENRGGILYSLNYGEVIAAAVDPVEKKPLFHFLPQSLSYSIACAGCNFSCAHCQNADISQIGKKIRNKKERILWEKMGMEMTPEEVVHNSLNAKCQSISYTYTEPTVFVEYALDVMKLAKKTKLPGGGTLKNVWVSNGYQTTETIDMVAPYLDAANIDLKAFTDKFYRKVCGARLNPVLNTLKKIKKEKIWLEITTLIIPSKNDSSAELKALAEFIATELGIETPWHISAFYPTYKMMNVPPTENDILFKAYDIGKAAGLKYVYTGNIAEEKRASTYCSKCQKLLIRRQGYNIERFDKNGVCPNCQNVIEGTFS